MRYVLVILWMLSVGELTAQLYRSEEVTIPNQCLKAGTGKAKYKESYNLYHIKDKSSYPLKELTVQTKQEDAEWYATGTLSGTAVNLVATGKEGDGLLLKVAVQDTAINRLRFTIPCDADEQFYGFGEQFSHFNMKGKKVPIWVQEQGIGRGDGPISFFMSLVGIKGSKFHTYAPMPVFVSTKGRAFYVGNSSYIEIDLTRKNEITFEVWDNELSLRVWKADEPLQLIEKLTEETGRMPQLPGWAYGTWLGLQGGAEKVTKIVDDALAANNPVTAVWIQDWVGKRQVKIGSRLWWHWRADTSLYGDFPAFCKAMNERGVKVLGYINSFLALNTPMADEAVSKGLLLKNHEAEPLVLPAGGFDAYMLDLTNPATQKWLKEIIKTNMIEAGLHGWMADFSEGPPMDAVLHSGEPIETYHNRYSVDWVRLNREAIKEAGKEGEIVFFNRAGFTHSPEHSTLFWAGDQMHSYGKNDGLKSAINGILTGGISGISLNHSDIGGYTSVKQPILRSKRKHDLFYRWTEVNAFMPVFRTHEGLRPEINVQSYTDSAAQQFFARFGRIHKALEKYIYNLNMIAAKTGHPVVRHPWLQFPEDAECQKLQYQFMLGDALLVAPVLKKKAKRVKAYLPPGQWQHIFTGQTYTGGQYHKVDAPYGQPAVFYNLASPNVALVKELLAAEIK